MEPFTDFSRMEHGFGGISFDKVGVVRNRFIEVIIVLQEVTSLFRSIEGAVSFGLVVTLTVSPDVFSQGSFHPTGLRAAGPRDGGT